MVKPTLGVPIPVGIIDPVEGGISTDMSPNAEQLSTSDGNASPASLPKLWVDTMMAPLTFWTSVMAAFLQSLDRSRPPSYGGATDRPTVN
jgi:hypothetical protein